MSFVEMRPSDNIGVMSNTTDTVTEDLAWDAQFAPHTDNLGKPIDVLPNISSEEEFRLLQDAHLVYESLRRFDTEYTEALTSPDAEKRRLARDVEAQHKLTVAMLLLKMDGAKQNILEHGEILGAIRAQYEAADRQFFAEQQATDGTLSMDRRVELRLAAFRGAQVATDVDKTITTHADYLQMIPGSVQAENYMAHHEHGRETFPLVFTRYWREAMNRLASNFFEIGANVPFRPGVEEFFRRTEAANVPVSVASANFRPLVDGVISGIHTTNIRQSYAVETDDIRATDKSTVIQEIAMQLPDEALIYIGDGDSDEPATDPDASRVVAFYLALKGGSFARKLREKGLPFYEFETFHDVINILTRHHVIANPNASA